MQISNNKVLITGGNSGIGFALAEKFLSLDNEVIITGRNEKTLNAAKSKYPKLHTFQCDIANQQGIDSLVLFIEQSHPDLNVLINNAGIQYNYQFLDEKELIYKVSQEIQVNLTAPIQLVSLLLPVIQENSNAAIVNVSSGLAFAPKQSAPVYCGTKAGIHIFTKALRYQLAPKGIKVFELIPPLVATPMTEGRGKGKLTPADLATEFIGKFKRDVFEMNIGKTKLLRFIKRISPNIADRILMNS